MLGCGRGTGEEKARPSATCTEGSGSKGSFESPASVATCDSPMTRSRYRAAGISPTIHEHAPSHLNSSGTRDINPASKECGGGGSFVGMIHVHAKTEAAGKGGGAADKRGKGKSTSHLKTASRGWCYNARLALAEKGEIHVDRAQF